jgi:hypothetical protein
MDETREHHLKQSYAQTAKNHMSSFICKLQTQNKCNNFIEFESHTKGRTCTREIGKGKEPYNLTVVDVLSVEEQI